MKTVAAEIDEPGADPGSVTARSEVVQATPIPDLPGLGGPGDHRGQRRQRRRRHRHLRLGGRPVPIPDPVLHGAGHGGPGLRPGDGRPPRRLHRQGPGRPHPGGVQPPSRHLRPRLPGPRQRGAGGIGIRRHRRRSRTVRREPLLLDPDRRRRHLGAGPVWLLPLCRAHLPRPLAGLLRLSARRHSRPTQLEQGARQYGVAPFHRQQGIPAPRSRPHRHHHHPVHAALCRRGGR